MSDYEAIFNNNNKDEQAYNIIKHKILTLEYPPKMLLREIELSEELAMSRTPVRAAITRLISDGFVVELGPRRNMVSDVSVVAFMNIYQVREVLENLCITLACYAWQDPSELQPLRELLNEQSLLTQSPPVESRAFLETDRKFHWLLAKLSRNDLLSQEMMRVYELYWRYNFYSLHRSRPNQIVQEHTAILEAVESRDKAAATACMKDHLLQTKDEILIGLAKGFRPEDELKRKKRGYFLKDDGLRG